MMRTHHNHFVAHYGSYRRTAPHGGETVIIICRVMREILHLPKERPQRTIFWNMCSRLLLGQFLLGPFII